MKRLSIITVIMLMLVTVTTSVSAKPKKDKKVEALYIFGMAASFNDSTVYFTDIQQIRNVWMDGKKRFVKHGNEYSAQLRNYLEDRGMPKRVCTVFYDKKLKKVQKRYNKLKSKYAKTGKYDIRNVDMSDFQFQAVDNN